MFLTLGIQRSRESRGLHGSKGSENSYLRACSTAAGRTGKEEWCCFYGLDWLLKTR